MLLFLFTVPLLDLLELLLRFTVPPLDRLELLLRLTVPLLRLLFERFLFTDPLERLLLLPRFTVPRFVLLPVDLFPTEDVPRVLLTVPLSVRVAALLLSTLEVRALDRTALRLFCVVTALLLFPRTFPLEARPVLRGSYDRRVTERSV